MATITDIAYLDHAELYRTTKPYQSDYSANGIPFSNFRTNIVKDVKINDMRLVQHAFWKDGFEAIHFDSSLKHDDFAEQVMVEGEYCRELGELLVSHLGAVAVQAFEAIVRRRHPTYPEGQFNVKIRQQPALRPHIDASPTQTLDRVKTLAAGTQFENWQGAWMFVNTWKPIRGPLRDWPLALCAPDSVKDDDLIAADNVRGREHAENQMLCADQGHRWWYVSNQDPSDLLLFRQADSEGNRGVPHTSFRLAVDDVMVQPRESVEVRYIAWFDGPLPKLGNSESAQ